MKSKEIKNIFNLLVKLDVSFAICLLLAVIVYAVTYSLEHIADDMFWIMMVLAMLTTYYFLRQDVIVPLTLLGKNSRRINKGSVHKFEDIDTDTPEFAEIIGSFNSVIRNMERATDFVQEIESGNLDAQMAVEEQEMLDRLSQALLNMRDTMKRLNLEEKQRSWATQGVAMLSEILRTNNQDVKGLSRFIMAGLVPYIEATQGAIFVLQDETEEAYHLQMTGMYAYGRQKYIRRDIQVGKQYADTLIGQVFLERASLIVRQMPAEYLEITSGLGNASPKFLIIVPLLVDNDTYGVIEIASFHELAPYQIQFLERVTESIALTIASVRINEHTKSLLEESQRQGEQLKAQEEEMRQNLEELAATQEEMERKNRELEAANNKNLSNAKIMEKALLKSRELQKEMAEKNARLETQEEEMRQNLEELAAAQDDMEKKNRELEVANTRILANTQIMEKALTKARDMQKNMTDKNRQLEEQEAEMRRHLEELRHAREELAQQKEALEEKNRVLLNKENILKKFIDKANTSDTRHKTLLREKDQRIKELEEKLARYEGQ